MKLEDNCRVRLSGDSAAIPLDLNGWRALRAKMLLMPYLIMKILMCGVMVFPCYRPVQTCVQANVFKQLLHGNGLCAKNCSSYDDTTLHYYYTRYYTIFPLLHVIIFFIILLVIISEFILIVFSNFI